MEQSTKPDFTQDAFTFKFASTCGLGLLTCSMTCDLPNGSKNWELSSKA